MKLTQTLAAVLLASATGLTFAADAAPAAPADNAAPKAEAKKPVHHKHHAKKKAAAKKAEPKTDSAAPAAGK